MIIAKKVKILSYRIRIIGKISLLMSQAYISFSFYFSFATCFFF